MNTRHLIIALSFAAAGSAFAQEATVFPPSGPSNTTRAEVKAVLEQARAAGELRVNEADFAQFPTTASSRTREEVRAEVRAAIASGELRAWNAEAISYVRGVPSDMAVQPTVTAARR
jgi:hypothetical protein